MKPIDIWQALLEGKTIVHKYKPLKYKIIDGHLMEKDMNIKSAKYVASMKTFTHYYDYELYKEPNIERQETSQILQYTLGISKRSDSKATEMLKATSNNLTTWSISKLNRWIGYAQCLLVAEGATTIDKLRKAIREIHDNNR